MMRRSFALVLFAVFCCAGTVLAADVEYAAWFGPQTMRVDLYHTGTKELSSYSLDEVMSEGPWAGARTKLVDTTNRGHSLFQVFDKESNSLLYSRGFSTMFGEWQTTNEAMQRSRTMNESVRFPQPLRPFILTVSERNRDQSWREVYRVDIDPNYHQVRKEIRYRDVEVLNLHVPAEPNKTYDILILPDGYTAAEQEKLKKDAERVAGYYLAAKPYSEMKEKIAIRALGIVSRDSGIDNPRTNDWKDTALSTSFNSFDSDRYVLSLANKEMRDYAANAPYEVVVLMCNTTKYGGGGIFNLFNTFAVDNEHAAYLVLHESGHSFAALGDEYYTSDVAYNEFYPQGVEPWEPNITALLDPQNVKWKAYITEGTPIPTPATKEYADVVGVFEGAGYAAKGLYRPALDCLMFSRNEPDLDPVCLEAVRSLLLFYVEE